jgi:hypothetical protein
VEKVCVLPFQLLQDLIFLAFFPFAQLQGLTVGERLRPTIDQAEAQKIKYAAKAKMIGFALNAAIGLQVLIGSLITGLSSVTSGRQVGHTMTMVIVSALRLFI